MLEKIDDLDTGHSAVDTAMMERCIRLSATSVERGEMPFAALICSGDKVITETTNKVVHNGDVTQHAELVAISAAQRKLGRSDLSNYTLYSTVEPCAMCSYAIRETRVGRVVFSIRSPMMGGFSKWNVLRDTELSRAMPEAFGAVPEVIAGLSQREAEKVWRAWNPLFWAVIKHRGYLGGEAASAGCEHLHAIPRRISLVRRLFMLHQNHRSA
jgi:tRNA(adenine34) deaminase